MADAEQVELLRRGAQVFNEWRTAEQEAVVDLAGADLTGLDLENVFLSGADLAGADLSKVDLRRTSLDNALEHVP
jgi:uncharacterized protein YjbI with pentapeptide repeats